MPSKAYYENLEPIEVFAATSISTTTDSGAPTAVDRTTDGGSENAIGCDHVYLLPNVTVAPSADTALAVYAEWSIDGINWTNSKFCITFAVAASETGRLEPLRVDLIANYAKFYLRAPQATLTAALQAIPGQWEGQ